MGTLHFPILVKRPGEDVDRDRKLLQAAVTVLVTAWRVLKIPARIVFFLSTYETLQNLEVALLPFNRVCTSLAHRKPFL